jgi:hypothetical protein
MNDTENNKKSKNTRKQTAQQKLNNFLRSEEAKTYPLCITKKMILHALASYCYYKEECNPSLKSICEYTSLLDPENVAFHLSELEMLSLIKITKKNGSRNKYLWLIPEIKDQEIYRKKSVDKIRISENK